MLQSLIPYFISLLALCLPQMRGRLTCVLGFATLGLAYHLLHLHTGIDTPQGQNLSLPNLFSFIASLWVFMTIFIAIFRRRMVNLLWVVLPVAMLSLVWEANSREAWLIPLGAQPLELSHVLASLVAYALLGVAAMQALALLAQLYCLKRAPDAPWLERLPPIEEMQQLMRLSLILGFTLLTLGMVGGFASTHDLTRFISKGALTLVAWAIYAALLLTHALRGLKPRPAAWWVLVGWLFLTFAYFGTRLMAVT